MLQPFWLVGENTKSFLSNKVVTTIMDFNVEDIKNLNVPNDAKLVLSPMTIQMALCNLAESKHIPHLNLIDN